MKWLNSKRPASLVFGKVVSSFATHAWSLSLALSRGDTSLPSWPLRSPDTWIWFKLMHQTGVFPMAWFAAPRCEASGVLLPILGLGDAWPCFSPQSIPRMDTCGCGPLLKSVRMETYACGFCTRLSPSVHASCEGASYIKVSAYLPHRQGFGRAVSCQSELRGLQAAFVPSVWRQFLWTFLLFFSVGLWFCLKAPVLRREACGGESLFSSLPFLSLQIFFLLQYVYFHCRLGFLCFGWMYWKVIPCI